MESLIYHYNDMHTRLYSIGMVVSGQERCLREYSYDSPGQVTKMRTHTDASGAVISTVRKEDGKDKLYFYNKDIKDSTTSLLDDAGTSAGIFSYSDFGETSEVKEVSISNEICYTGAVYDESTGLYYLK